MDTATLARELGLTEITVKEAARILGNRGGEFDIRMKLKKGEVKWGYADKLPNGRYKYVVFRELIEKEKTYG